MANNDKSRSTTPRSTHSRSVDRSCWKSLPKIRRCKAVLFLFLACLSALILNSISQAAWVPSQLAKQIKPPVLLLTAHPDDEVMFFAPTIRELRKNGIEMKVLCLSNGNAEGLGAVREREFAASLDALNIGKENGVVINHPKMKDNMTIYWNTEVILLILKPFVEKHGINSIITFDDYGVSGHPNHISLATATDRLLHVNTNDKSHMNILQLFHLVSQNRLLKYTGPLSRPFVYLGNSSRTSTVMDHEGYLQALGAMRQHQSQLIWFRYLYLLFSRYLYINDWKEWTSS